MAMSVSYTVVNGEVLSENRGGVKRDYMPDTLGSTVALLDNTQTKTDTWSYWPYGEVASRTGSNPTPFTFVGTLGYFKDQLKRLYVRARHLRVDLGQWITLDPLWPSESAYDYVSRPLDRSDPSGLLAGDSWIEELYRTWKFTPSPDHFHMIPGCAVCLTNRVKPALNTLSGEDKYLHCMGGCLAQNRCTYWCPPSLGTLKEVMDLLFGGKAEQADIPPTNSGWECGEEIRGGWKDDIKKCHNCCVRRGWKP